jgi:hypothetical protein
MATDEEIFASALTDEPAAPISPEPEPAPQAPEPTPEQPGQLRAPNGKFASKPKEEPAAPAPAEPAPPAAPAAPQPQEPPPGRFREVSERARRAEERAERLERDLRDFMASSRAPAQPAQAPADPFVRLMEDPGAVIAERASELLTPVQNEIGQLREFYSRREAIREHGEDTVRAAPDPP